MRLLAVTIVVLGIAIWSASAVAAPTPPKQPQKGPGGFDYKHRAATMASYGTGADGYWIYRPAEPAPKTAPVVVLLHGWGGMDPVSYGGWIDHLARKGNIVIFPRYQASLMTPASEMSANALKAVQSALAKLDEGPIKLQPGNFAIIGHSLGGVIAANLACDAAEGKLPQPKALVLVEPSDSKNSTAAAAYGQSDAVPSILRDYSAIPSDTLLLCIVGKDDKIVGSVAARNIFYRATKIPGENKDFATVVTDRRGSPQLIADHFAPLSPDERYREEKRSRLRDRLRDKFGKELAVAAFMENATTNALDYYCFWKLSDALIAAAFYGEYRDYALGCGYDQTFMGKWSDGVPVAQLEVTKTP
mgnify:CR=1 FL=1